MIKNTRYLICVIVVLIIFLSLYIYFKNINKKQDSFIDINFNDNLDIITNRTTILKNEILFIGSSLKELENGYFDISIKNIEKGLKLEVNKLTKGYIQNNIYDKNYLIEIFNYLNSKFEYKLDMQLFIKNVEDIYIILRSSYAISEDKKVEYIDNGICIKIYTLNYSIFIEIWRLNI